MKAILFDLDGTLVDHFGVIHRCIVYAQYQLGFPDSTLSQVKKAVGGGIHRTLGRLVGEDYVKEALHYYRECYDKIGHLDVKILPGIRWVLPCLKARGYRLAVFTNKHGGDARELLEQVHLDLFFDAIIGAGDSQYHKPDVEFTQFALESIGMDETSTVLIGDSPYDVETAQNAGMKVYCVTTGSHSRDQLIGSKPDGIYPNFFDLGEAVFDLKVPQLAKTA